MTDKLREALRYEIQEVLDSIYGKNYRVTDTTTDSRIATCFLRENAELVVAALNREALAEPDETFTTKELAQEILLWFQRDVPETVVRSLSHILGRFVETGVYDDGIEVMTGEKPEALLAIQRFALRGYFPAPDESVRREPVAWRYLQDPWGANEWTYVSDNPHEDDWEPLYTALGQTPEQQD